jgi:hypothetical protein
VSYSLIDVLDSIAIQVGFTKTYFCSKTKKTRHGLEID